MRLYVMRHCERDMDNCSFESELTKIGHINAQEVSNLMKKKNIDTIYSSPFIRTIQTSSYYSNEMNIPINIDYSIAEFVAFNDKHKMYSKNNYKIYDSWKQNYNLEYNMLKDSYNVNDSENDCILRVSVFLYNIISKYKDTDKNILIVTHMSIVNVILGIHTNKIYDKNFNIDKSYDMGLITELK